MKNGETYENYKLNNNNLYDKEIKLKFQEINKKTNINKNVKRFSSVIKSIKSETNNLNNKYFEIKKYRKLFGNRKMNNNKFIFNLTKKYKIFHKFLCLGVDTSGLYSLDDDMKNFILNPKITYNFPINNLESELEQ